ncbi:MAG: phosphatase PAP2 family protein [Nitrospinae bacterium]|nr:phosphatase PAP2 family protein [Nitrospinota bacterium]
MRESNEQLFWLVNGHHSSAGDYLFWAVSFTAYTLPAICVALAAMHFYRGLTRGNVVLLAIALAAGGLAVHGIKEAYIADRPLAYFAEKNPPLDSQVHAPFERHSHRSFPSGHSQVAANVAVLMVLLFRRHIALWLIWAGLVAYSRVYLGVHFPLDVVFGALTGSLISILAVKGGRRWNLTSAQQKVSSPSPAPGSATKGG